MKIVLLFISLVFFTGQKVNGQNCEYASSTKSLSCTCASNEDIEVFWKENHNVSSLTVSSCNSAKLEPSIRGINLPAMLTSLRIENIKNNLYFCPVLSMRHFHRIEFSNIGNISEFKNECTFDSITKLDYFHMNDTVIGRFDQTFYKVEIKEFILQNVTISNMDGLTLDSQNGSVLKIINSYLNVTEQNVFLHTFNDIQIVDSIIEFPKGGNISINGTQIHLSNNIFINASVNVIGKQSIHLTNTCADGRNSAMRLHSTHPHNHSVIVSHGNSVPTGIIYVFDDNRHDEKHSKNKNNSICKGAKCNCLLKKPIDVFCMSTGCKSWKMKSNYGKSIHQESTRVFFLSFITFAYAIVARI